MWGYVGWEFNDAASYAVSTSGRLTLEGNSNKHNETSVRTRRLTPGRFDPSASLKRSTHNAVLALSIACTIDTIAYLCLSWQDFLRNGICPTQIGLNGALFASMKMIAGHHGQGTVVCADHVTTFPLIMGSRGTFENLAVLS